MLGGLTVSRKSRWLLLAPMLLAWLTVDVERPAFSLPPSLRRKRRAILRRSALPPSAVPMALPRHATNEEVNRVLQRTEALATKILAGDDSLWPMQKTQRKDGLGKADRIYANTYVDLGDAEVVGFDYDYTLVSYRPAVLDLIYDLSVQTLVQELGYPQELLEGLPGYDSTFAIRGLAVDLETAWICMLTLRYRVSTAFFGRERVNQRDVEEMYRSEAGAGIMQPEDRKRRLKPLNDLFSNAEACVLADVVQWFRDRSIRFDPRSVVNDVMQAVGKAHLSGEMHKSIASNLDKYIEADDNANLHKLLKRLRMSGKKLIMVSNSPFWFVDAGMSHVVGSDWRSLFDNVVVSAGKPAFYTQCRPFREVSTKTGRIKFKPIETMKPGDVYCQGSMRELMQLTGLGRTDKDDPASHIAGSKFLYLGDSLFADLVEARRLYGWTTGAIIREVGYEIEVQNSQEYQEIRSIVRLITRCFQVCQDSMHQREESGKIGYTMEDTKLLDALENLAAEWRRRLDALMNPNFGSIFRSSKNNGRTAQLSLFARCLQRHVDFYTSRVENLHFYSSDYRLYPLDDHIGMMHESPATADPILDALRSSDSDLE